MQLERFTNAIKKEIEIRDEQKVQAEKLKEAEKTKQIDEEEAVDGIMDFLELPEGKEDMAMAAAHRKKLPESLEEMKTTLFELPEASSLLPAAITERVGRQAIMQHISAANHQDWKALVSKLQETGLSGVAEEDFSKLVYKVPLDQRADVLPQLHEMAWEAGIPLSKLVYDNTMAGYAHRGDTKTVRAFMEQMTADGLEPDAYTYGHLLKSLGKHKDLVSSVKALREMQLANIAPTLPLYTTLLQTCIKAKDYNQAFEVFDMLKFLGTNVHPDCEVYNSVIFAAAKTNNLERAMDLYREMQNNGVQPNVDTYATMIYTCSRNEKLHVRAWETLIEMYDRGIEPNRKILNHMLYLCGSTGELSFARAIFRQLCTNIETYPDSFSLTCLLKAYANYKPGFFSPVLSTAVGPKLRAAFFFNTDIAARVKADITPPLLPAPMLSSVAQVLAESRAVFNFYKDLTIKPDGKDGNESEWQKKTRAVTRALINPHTVYAYLDIPCKLNHEAEFRWRWTHETTVAVVANPTTGVPDTRTPRNNYMYTLAINAYAQHGWTQVHAQGLWESRGEWRRNPNSIYRTAMTPEERANSDFKFAQAMVAYLSKVNLLEDAVDIVKSTTKQFKWRKAHLLPVLDAAQAIEDEKTLHTLKGIIASYYKND